MTQFVLIAAATLISEDLTCIGAGALIAAGKIGFLPGVLACVAGIYFGDLLLYFAGRLIGRPILCWKPLRTLLTEEKLDGTQVAGPPVNEARFGPSERMCPEAGGV